jgi:hypothetical protein
MNLSDLWLEHTSDDLFSFGVAELAHAEALNTRPAPTPPVRPAAPAKPKNVGFDPYNSGVFDKRKAWTSVRKR